MSEYLNPNLCHIYASITPAILANKPKSKAVIYISFKELKILPSLIMQVATPKAKNSITSIIKQVKKSILSYFELTNSQQPLKPALNNKSLILIISIFNFILSISKFNFFISQNISNHIKTSLNGVKKCI
ncbi:hypothetical protein LMG7974_01662 [Campylobacter majalis]|uniref:Uncharacterized protein n=1 Tax=Campylobacter majalis TaxID=2790656 RepID=A0ABM8Q9I8_9BACT|nr:hypothetical protein [Campylobacter majalis]CAD7289585.1 hypothetical protein LMG7974_01662 [Campylobacter majalis]